MFAGRRRQSSNIRVMQLFHELKQQFPTVPDHVVSACIASHAQLSTPSKAIREILEAAASLNQQSSMGRSPSSQDPPTPSHPSPPIATEQSEMNDSDCDNIGVTFSKKYESVNVCTTSQAVLKEERSGSIKRPDKLNIKPDATEFSRTIQPSEKCKDVFKLLNSDNVSEKPPRSPSTHKKLTKVLQEEGKKTASTPTQTTDTLLGEVNLSLNVNCSVLQSPTRRQSVLRVVPQQPWLQEPTSPRSYTSVNLTLRPPSSEPQPPIDITSQNSSLTYSTSSYDSQKGLQSRLQITVGPTGGNVSATRVRPRSSYHEETAQEVVPVRAGSLNDLKSASDPPVILKQQARIERLKIELRSEKAKLEVIQNEVTNLENTILMPIEYKIDAEIEKQLRREIKHLQYQCEQLALEADKNIPVGMQEDFYQNIYTGQRGPLNLDTNVQVRQLRSTHDQSTSVCTRQESEGPMWNCHLCTFLNHPYLDKCEECDMPRILHGKTSSTATLNNNLQQLYPTNFNLMPSSSLPNLPERRPIVIDRPIGFLINSDVAQRSNSQN